MNVAAVTVSTTATALHSVTDSAGRTYRTLIVDIENVSTSDVYIGASDVATTTGYKLSPGQSRKMIGGHGRRWYGRVASGTAEVRVSSVELQDA